MQMKRKKIWGSIIISNKIDFKTKAVERDKEWHHVNKENNPTRGYTLVNIYGPNIGAPKYVKQFSVDINGETDRIIDIVGDLNIPLTSMDRSSRQKINKETATWNNTPGQMDLIGIFRAFYPKAAEYTYFSSAHGTFSRIDHILGHKTSLNKFKKTEIISSIFYDHNTMKLEINHKNTEKNTNTWKLN